MICVYVFLRAGVCVQGYECAYEWMCVCMCVIMNLCLYMCASVHFVFHNSQDGSARVA